MLHTDTFRLQADDAIVHFLHEGTVYETLGDAPWWIVSLLLFAGAFVRRRLSAS
jgi:hypothetical protein